MRRFAGVGADSVEFGALDGIGESADQSLELGDGATLFEDEGIELIVTMLEMGERGFDALEALLEGVAHGRGALRSDGEGGDSRVAVRETHRKRRRRMTA